MTDGAPSSAPSEATRIVQVTPMMEQYLHMKDKLLGHSGVLGVSSASNVPPGNINNYTNAKQKGQCTNKLCSITPLKENHKLATSGLFFYH